MKKAAKNQTRVLFLGWGNEYIVPESMSDRELTALMAQLLMMQPANSVGYTDEEGNYRNAFYALEESAAVRVKRVELYSEAEAKSLALETKERKEKQAA
jgi:hypothetical protein